METEDFYRYQRAKAIASVIALDPVLFGSCYRNVRESLGIMPSKLSALIHKTPSDISKFERGEYHAVPKKQLTQMLEAVNYSTPEEVIRRGIELGRLNKELFVERARALRLKTKLSQVELAERISSISGLSYGENLISNIENNGSGYVSSLKLIANALGYDTPQDLVKSNAHLQAVPKGIHSRAEQKIQEPKRILIEDKVVVGSCYRNIRESLGLTLADAASRIGKTPGDLSRFELGKYTSVSVHMLPKLLETIKCSTPAEVIQKGTELGKLDKKLFGERARALRMKAGWSQTEMARKNPYLAAQSNPQDLVYNAEASGRGSEVVLKSIANALGYVTPHELVKANPHLEASAKRKYSPPAQKIRTTVTPSVEVAPVRLSDEESKTFGFWSHLAQSYVNTALPDIAETAEVSEKTSGNILRQWQDLVKNQIDREQAKPNKKR